jgi:hypothetical protein
MGDSVLSRIFAQIKSARTQRPVVLFDLDGTLFDNRPRTLRILHAYAAQLPREHQQDARAIRALNAQDVLYLLEDTLAPRGVKASVIEGAKSFWRARFFTDAACADDVPVAGAVPFVRRCWDEGATVVYLTGRDIPGMILGTTRTLRDDGFPLGVPRTELVMKPTFDEPDTTFKLRLLDSLHELGKVVASFDNEPVNCNLFYQRWPEAFSVLLETQSAPGAPELLAGCHRVPDFTDFAEPHG